MACCSASAFLLIWLATTSTIAPCGRLKQYVHILVVAVVYCLQHPFL